MIAAKYASQCGVDFAPLDKWTILCQMKVEPKLETGVAKRYLNFFTPGAGTEAVQLFLTPFVFVKDGPVFRTLARLLAVAVGD